MNKKLVSILAGIMAGILLVSLMLGLLSSVFANAASSSEILNQIQQLESEKAVVDAELNKWEALLSNHLKDMQAMIDQNFLKSPAYATKSAVRSLTHSMKLFSFCGLPTSVQ